MKHQIFIALALLLPQLIFAEGRLIIKFKPNKQQFQALAQGDITQKQLSQQLAKPYTTQQLNALSTVIGAPVTDKRSLTTGAHVITIEKNMQESEITGIIKKLSRESTIDYVVIDRKMQKMQTQYNNF